MLILIKFQSSLGLISKKYFEHFYRRVWPSFLVTFPLYFPFVVKILDSCNMAAFTGADE